MGLRIRGEVHVCSVDQTPAHFDSMEGESLIVAKGAMIVAIGPKKVGARTTRAAALYLTGAPSRPPPPAVTFRATSGVRFAKAPSEDAAKKSGPSRRPPTSFFAPSGKTTMDATPHILSALEKGLGPTQKVLHRQMMGEWAAPLYDSYKVRKSSITGHIQNIPDAKLLPERMFGGATGLLRCLGTGVHRRFKEALNEIQGEQDLAARRDRKKAETPTRMDFSDRVCDGYSSSLDTQAPPGGRKEAGITNSLAWGEDDLMGPGLYAIWMKHGM